MKQFVKRILGPTACRAIRTTQRRFRASLVPSDLSNLALLYGSDKWMPHWYTPHYECHLASLRYRRVRVLEIGIGGDSDPRAGGASLRMWKRYFPFGKIFGLDIFDKHELDEPRIKTFQGDQSDPEYLHRVIAEIGAPDLIIDDGSHQNAHVILSFNVLFPLLASDGIYVVEDTQTSYWRYYGGNNDKALRPPTTMNFFIGLVDGLNHEEFIQPGYTPSYLDTHVVSLHFYHNLIFVQKGLNKEGSIWKQDHLAPGVTEPV